MCGDASARDSGWVDTPEPPTFVPFDRLTIIHGIPAIVAHLAQRDRIYGAPKILSRPVACWQEGQGVVLVAEASVVHCADGGAAEVRRMMLMIAATTGSDVKLRHVSEAVPAVLPLVIAAYGQLHNVRTAS